MYFIFITFILSFILFLLFSFIGLATKSFRFFPLDDFKKKKTKWIFCQPNISLYFFYYFLHFFVLYCISLRIFIHSRKMIWATAAARFLFHFESLLVVNGECSTCRDGEYEITRFARQGTQVVFDAAFLLPREKRHGTLDRFISLLCTFTKSNKKKTVKKVRAAFQ